jgi:N-acetylmuramic acid 6-phosphate etherase
VSSAETILGIEGGGTKTAWVLIKDRTVLDSGKRPPSNLRLTPADQLTKIFRALPRQASRIGAFLAGCVTDEDRSALRKLAREVWPAAQIVVGSDRESGMAACLRDRDGIVVNAGTGSSVTGRRGDQIEQAGGWGHILGDTGGAYFVSIRGLRLVLRDYDLRRGNRRFAANILAGIGLNNFDELVRWAQTADKTNIAALAPIVFAAAANEPAVERIIHASAAALADFTTAVAARLELEAPEVCLMGGLFEHQPDYADMFATSLREKLPRAPVALATTAPELGAAWLAGGNIENASDLAADTGDASPIIATEAANPKSENLERLSSRQLVELFVAEEKSVESALRQRMEELAEAVDLASATLANNGRMFYVGAGTSGRLGALDAAEIPPTFGAPPNLIQAIIAGGTTALQRSVEGAEDDETNGALAVDARNVAPGDLVIGISASGRAPFVRGALARAREIGVKTILVTCNKPSGNELFDLLVDLPTGPEIVTGSTRLKAGTATKIALNIISTGAMVRLGRVHGNLMIDLQPTNKKLRERAVRLVSQLSCSDEKTARRRLESAGWNVRAALKYGDASMFPHQALKRPPLPGGEE